jgi:DNA-binding beta-propeller fold protein YncE
MRHSRQSTLSLGGFTLFVLALVPLSNLGCASGGKSDNKPAAFWPAYPDEPRIQYLVSFSASSDIAPKKSGIDQLIYGKEAEQVLAVKKPYGLKMHNGKVYVCDLRNSCITVLDLRKQQTLILGRSGADSLEKPSDIAIASDGTKYVADHSKERIYVFSADDRQVTSFTAPDMKPVGIAVFQNDLFVCDFKGQCVRVFDRRSYRELRKIGGPGSGPGQFVRPLGIGVDNQGFVYVVDVLNCKMQKFSRDGKLVTAFGGISANAGGFVRPKHIAVDAESQIYVVDAAFQNVQIFDQIGRPLTFFGSAGTHPGAMFTPVGVAVCDTDLDVFAGYVHPAFEAKRLILVSNQFGDAKISVYALGHLKPGKTVQDISASQGLVTAGVGDQKLTGPGAPLSETSAPPDEGPGANPATRPAAPKAAPKAAPTTRSSNAVTKFPGRG